MAVDIFIKIDTVDGEAQDCYVGPINKKFGSSRENGLSSNRIIVTNQLPPTPSFGFQVNF
jgi:hypothetical protein